jgi:lysophospholipase
MHTSLGIVLLLLACIVAINFYRRSSLAEALQLDTTPESKKRLVESDSYKAPPGYILDAITVVKDLELRTATWITPVQQFKGSILILTGRGEFIEKYYETIRDLLDLGYNVVIFDWRGQGLSSRLLVNKEKGFVVNFNHFLDDIEAVYTQKMVDLPHPHLLLGHSMGGHLALRELQDHPDRYHRAVLCAPMQSIAGLSSGTLGKLALLFKALGLSQAYVLGGGAGNKDKKVDKYTSDINRFKKWTSIFKKEPRLLMGSATWQWSKAATISMAYSMRPKQLLKIKTPVYLASAKADTIVNGETHETLDDINPNIQVVPYEGAKHEIYTEIDAYRNRFLSEVDNFFSEK